jgi:hypothetical protein
MGAIVHAAATPRAHRRPGFRSDWHDPEVLPGPATGPGLCVTPPVRRIGQRDAMQASEAVLAPSAEGQVVRARSLPMRTALAIAAITEAAAIVDAGSRGPSSNEAPMVDDMPATLRSHCRRSRGLLLL